jgi:SMODS-associated and fused to various effectors sensor domain
MLSDEGAFAIAEYFDRIGPSHDVITTLVARVQLADFDPGTRGPDGDVIGKKRRLRTILTKARLERPGAGDALMRRLSMTYASGVDHVDAAVAAAATATFGPRLKRLRDEGVTEVHVFLAGPAPLALLLGASVNAGPAMSLYHTVDGEYVRSVRLIA